MSNADWEEEQEVQAAEQLRSDLDSFAETQASDERPADPISESAAFGRLIQVVQQDWTVSSSDERRADLLDFAERHAAKKSRRLASVTVLRRMLFALPAAAAALLVLRWADKSPDSSGETFAPRAAVHEGAERLPSEFESVRSTDLREDVLRAQALSLARRAAGGNREQEDASLAIAWRQYRGTLIAELGEER